MEYTLTTIVGKVEKTEAKEVEQLVKKCVRLLRKKEYELNLPTNSPDVAAKVLTVKRRKNSPSKAGAHTIVINLGYWQFGNEYHTEYKSFRDDPTIGKIKVNDDKDHLMIMVAHEVAHHIQFRYAKNVQRFKSTYRKPHGECFKAIYRYLRQDLVNPYVKGRA